MKIVCMDCQMESHIEVGLLKDKKRFECEHCAKKLPASSTNHDREQNHSFAGDSFDYHALSASEVPSEKGISLYSEDEVLEIPPLSSMPEPSQPLEADEIISVPFYDLTSASSEEDVTEEEATASFVYNDPPKEAFALQSPRQLPQTFVPAVEVSSEIPDSSNLHEPVEETLDEMPVMPTGVKVMTVKTSVLMWVAVVFVSFIALGDKIIRPADKTSPAAENSRPVIKSEREIKPPAPVASSARPETINSVQPEPPKPIPTPAAAPVAETKPADAPPPTNQPPAAADGQFTVQVGSHNDVGQANEQAGKLRAAGFEPRVVSVDIPKRGRWYRVQSGSFSNRDEANRYGAQILAKDAAENFVIAGL